ncbi:MAG TPA: hypothetical protein VLA61_04790 [Ideonella sp.]|nr:hypothetical protein [Ideonella sp.]HSI47559.1 hypothetical protein [Ideonella sp.]
MSMTVGAADEGEEQMNSSINTIPLVDASRVDRRRRCCSKASARPVWLL